MSRPKGTRLVLTVCAFFASINRTPIDHASTINRNVEQFIHIIFYHAHTIIAHNGNSHNEGEGESVSLVCTGLRWYVRTVPDLARFE